MNHITYVSLQCEIYRKVNFLYEFKILRLFYGRKRTIDMLRKGLSGSLKVLLLLWLLLETFVKN